MKKLNLFLLFTIFIATGLFSQQRNVRPITVKTKNGENISLYKNSYALVVGVSIYSNGWSRLPNAIKDAKEVKEMLETKHGFVVDLVENPTGTQMENAIKNFIASRGKGKDDRLLFYFAGHGHTHTFDYGGEMGYIVPADAPLPGSDMEGFLKKAISMENFNTYARSINSKHALFIFDSCFSGSIFALSRALPDAISYKTAKPVRQFITAGSADETVPDRSIFKQQFLDALAGEADKIEDGYITGTELGEFLQTTVINYSFESQHPQYGKIRDPKLDKGDFVFVVPVKEVPEPPKPQLDLSRYEDEASHARAVRTKWDTWQNNMKENYNRIIQLDKDTDLTATSKAQMWKDFLSNYKEDNPYSYEDNEMRTYAISRQDYWQEQPKTQPPIVDSGTEKQTYTQRLRDKPVTGGISVDDVKAMLKDKKFFDSSWNKDGEGFNNNFVLQKNGQVVYDRNSGLMWQQAGSDNYMTYEDAKKYMDKLNNERFASYDDWRLPTLEEAMSLLEPKKNSDGLYIDQKFDKTQSWIWTSDLIQGGSRAAWVVFFYDGDCYWNDVNVSYVRAVRSRQSSIE